MKIAYNIKNENIILLNEERMEVNTVLINQIKDTVKKLSKKEKLLSAKKMIMLNSRTNEILSTYSLIHSPTFLPTKYY